MTGVSTGIGRAVACALAEQGLHVAFTFINSQDAAEETRAKVAGFGVEALAVCCDVGTKAEVDAFYERVAEWKGAPDFLVNNAGIQTWAPLLDLEEEDWDRVIRTNLKGCFLNTQAAARQMRDAGKGGAIVNIGSGCNKLAFPGSSTTPRPKAGSSSSPRRQRSSLARSASASTAWRPARS